MSSTLNFVIRVIFIVKADVKICKRAMSTKIAKTPLTGNSGNSDMSLILYGFQESKKVTGKPSEL